MRNNLKIGKKKLRVLQCLKVRWGYITEKKNHLFIYLLIFNANGDKY